MGLFRITNESGTVVVTEMKKENFRGGVLGEVKIENRFLVLTGTVVECLHCYYDDPDEYSNGIIYNKEMHDKYDKMETVTREFKYGFFNTKTKQIKYVKKGNYLKYTDEPVELTTNVFKLIRRKK